MTANVMRRWLDAATMPEIERLATYASTSIGTLRQIAGGYRNDGRAVVEAALAGRIESAAARLRRHNPALPEVLRTHLCPACRGCQYAKTCLAR